eukprot:TRINITY_DN6032_c0_g1_i1.p1 TRINITY_DN6032_c0_g1~~TRINITY_DN6032_c0_g1_i1.p1  ORF type:complete len:99 (-),score=15.00 TRINITY_DN6032_c0_g1_i1:212-508(-)
MFLWDCQTPESDVTTHKLQSSSLHFSINTKTAQKSNHFSMPNTSQQDCLYGFCVAFRAEFAASTSSVRSISHGLSIWTYFLTKRLQEIVIRGNILWIY